MRVLIIEDEKDLGELIQEHLEEYGYEVKWWGTGTGALEVFQAFHPDLVILDVMLPGVDGFTLCRKIRQESLTPIIMLTSRTEEADRIVGLELGADDYVAKPFSIRELVARARTQLRRQEALQSTAVVPVVSSITLLDCTLHPEERTVQVQGAPVDLTRREFDLLCHLMQRPGRVLTRDTLIEQVWGDDFDGFERTVDTHIKRLREKLGKDSEVAKAIQAVRGVGYRFQA
ncbi:response regulator transcription factor [Deinococcus cellulosilyticus]|uniref:DNA-binding response regulator n=1 Tax=Deinococcus cellulosilyticus (strain DSM 18568 / NBRC 106333 / KACC 11606 / 5516J-15) TaxID=1223518 RepID=A0A511MVR7_DEIC1|nr:response regulator transcription factor [Deinococcus cellulosilyticus]GEM44491.1 DNA-binding response regulator [Deinococcus cellulosilyticus NBRC 106333 = KACC 11606]